MKSTKLKIKRQDRKNRGITLIALVVTIVVLLILAAVSISMLGGENGIITQAIKAQDENEKAEEKEKVQLAATAAKTENNWGEITDINFRTELDTNIGNGKYTLSKNGDIFTVTYTDSNRSYEVDANGNVTGPTNSDDNTGGGETGSLTPGNRYDEDTDITIGDDKVTIPGGSTISKIPGEYESIDDGLVIYIIPKDETPDWEADEDGDGIKDVQEKYDQFVWVPVKNAVLDLSGNTEALASDDSIKAVVQSEIDAGRYPMAIKKDTTNYIGVLYKFEDATGTDGNNYVKVTPYSSWTPISKRGGNLEPGYLTDSDYADASSYNNVGITESSLQNEFNTMVTRVATKGGFWIGRYETSNMVEDSTQDTTNRITVRRGIITGINNLNWYRMYAQQKIYKSLALVESANVTSSMIWGSQWNQIMIWMKSIKSKYLDSEHSGEFFVTNSVSMGNYGIIDGIDDGWMYEDSPAPTGFSENYKVKNIFDLAGNVEEWTLEARSPFSRVLKGGDYAGYYNFSTAVTSYNIVNPLPTYLVRRF